MQIYIIIIKFKLSTFINKLILLFQKGLDMYKNGFSIITVTNRDYCIENMINNFLRQEFNDKELIIVINNDKINIEDIYK